MTTTDNPRKTGVTVWRSTKPPVDHPDATDLGLLDHSLRISRGGITIALYAAGCWEALDYHPTDRELAGVAPTEDGQR